MTLEVLQTAIDKMGPGWDDATSGATDMKSLVTELQGHKISIASAAGTGDCAAVTGMTASDTIKTVVKFVKDDSLSDITANYTACAGGMTCSKKADSDATQLLVFWVDKA